MIFIGQGNETAEFGLFRRASVARRGGSKEAALARLFIVSNRVGSSLKANEGGLATAIHAATEERDIVWFGPSGDQVAGSGGTMRREPEGRLMRLLVDLDPTDYDGYYNRFANRVLWPLFHYRIELAEFDRESWAAYCRVNEILADRLSEALAPDDMVWVHDYHLFPLADALRRRGCGNRIGFFLHIPFPAPEILTTLPVHGALMHMLFAYDLVGFQSDRDVQAFQDYVDREAGGRTGLDGLSHAYGRSLRAGCFPISIDTAKVANLAARSVRSRAADRLRASLSGRQLVIGVDRLDYSKGLIRRLAAVEHLFATRPALRHEVVMLQIAPPTREEVPEYQQIRADLDACIGRINGTYGEPDVLPVRYLNRHFRQEVLFGFYRASRIGLVTPLRDGMNLVAKEYVASQDPSDPGVLILSRFAGAALELEGGALIVNPYDVDRVSEALGTALAMPLQERRQRWETMMLRLERADVHAWYDGFVQALQRSRNHAANSASESEADPCPVWS
jgi:trehalose 6-phosphate synthase